MKKRKNLWLKFLHGTSSENALMWESFGSDSFAYATDRHSETETLINYSL